MITELKHSTQQIENRIVLDRDAQKQFIQQLESARPGLSQSCIFEQSETFVFKNGYIHTYNDEICCSVKCDLPFEGAVDSKTLLKQIKILGNYWIRIEQNDTSLVIIRDQSQTHIRLEPTICLDYKSVPTPGKWKRLPKEFAKAVETVAPCAGKNEVIFGMVQVHLTKEFIEACDDYRLCRYKMKTGIKQNMLIRADSLIPISKREMTHFSITPSWIHFRNNNGVRISCRYIIKEDLEFENLSVNKDRLYPCIDTVLDIGCETLTLQKKLIQKIIRVPIFVKASDRTNSIRFDVVGNILKVSGEGVFGYHEEEFVVDDSGTDFSFKISPALLTQIATKNTSCEVTTDRLKVDSESYVYVACLQRVHDEADSPSSFST